MKNFAVLAITLCLAVSLFGQEFKLGSKVADFAIQDTKGNTVQAAKLMGDVSVIMFIATKCPVSNDYNERMKAVSKDYTGKGVKFIAINANHIEPAAEVEEHAASHQFPFKVYKDTDNVVADRFAAQVTPEIFVLDKTRTIRYHGYIDDSRDGTKITTQGLRLALDSVLAGKPVEKAETKAFGCTIKRVKKTS